VRAAIDRLDRGIRLFDRWGGVHIHTFAYNKSGIAHQDKSYPLMTVGTMYMWYLSAYCAGGADD
jgi:hypothetical protein